MATRINVPGPEPLEESRQLAEVVADLHYVLDIIVENAKVLVPGEAVDELNQAWTKSQESMKTLVQNLIPTFGTDEIKRAAIPYDTLVKGELSGEVGKIKKSMLGRLKDRFLMFWNSEPHTDEKRIKAADAACDYLVTTNLFPSLKRGCVAGWIASSSLYFPFPIDEERRPCVCCDTSSIG